MKKKILFVTYGGGHVNLIIPIIKEMKKSSEFEYTVIGLNTAIPKLLDAKINYKSINDYIVYLQQPHKIYELGKKLSEVHHNYKLPELKIEHSIGYFGVGMYDLINTLGENEAWALFHSQGRKAFLPVSVFEKILDIEKPDYVITTCGVRFEKAVVLAANKKNINTIRIYNMWINPENFTPVKYHFVMNQHCCDKLIEFGIIPDKIFITGQPAFDNIFEALSITDKKNLLEELNLSEDKKIILWASDDLDPGDILLNEIIDTFYLLDEYQLIIKPHPNEAMERFEKALKERRLNNVVLLKDIDVQRLIKLSDIVITFVSTCGFEAYLASKILITVNLTGLTKYDFYKDMGISIHVDNKGKLAQVLPNTFSDIAYFKTITARIQYNVLPEAAKRVLDTILLNDLHLNSEDSYET